MPAYIISYSTQRGDDSAWRERYYQDVVPLLEKHGAKIVAAGALAPIERAKEWSRGAIIEFPDEAAAHAFYDDPDYIHAKGLRIFHNDGEIQLLIKE